MTKSRRCQPKQKCSKQPTRWYAATAEIARMGPFASQIEAWRALRRADGRANMPGDRVWPEAS